MFPAANKPLPTYSYAIAAMINLVIIIDVLRDLFTTNGYNGLKWS